MDSGRFRDESNKKVEGRGRAWGLAGRQERPGRFSNQGGAQPEREKRGLSSSAGGEKGQEGPRLESPARPGSPRAAMVFRNRSSAACEGQGGPLREMGQQRGQAASPKGKGGKTGRQQQRHSGGARKRRARAGEVGEAHEVREQPARGARGKRKEWKGIGVQTDLPGGKLWGKCFVMVMVLTVPGGMHHPFPCPARSGRPGDGRERKEG